MPPLNGEWQSAGNLPPRSYACGFCGATTGVKVGYVASNNAGFIYLCGGCNRPTFFEDGTKQTPSPIRGNEVRHLPATIEPIYEEARRCTQVHAYTACVLACRKILAHVAVAEGASEGLQFIQYVDYLANNGYVPPKGKGWVDHIRKKGNEATHEIVLMNQETASELLSFTELLLKFVYEMPARIMPRPDPEPSSGVPRTPLP